MFACVYDVNQLYIQYMFGRVRPSQKIVKDWFDSLECYNAIHEYQINEK